MRETKSTFVWCVIASAVAVAVTAGCGRQQQAPSMPPVLVSTAKPTVAAITNWDEYPGRLEAVEFVEVRPRVSGYIQSIHFEDGGMVSAGDLLFVIDPRPYEAELQRAEAECRRLEAALELARAEFARAEIMRAAKAISAEEFDARQATLKQTESALDAARAARRAAELNLEYTHVRAPITGRISRRLVTVGNLVQGGGMVPGTLLTTLVSVDPVYCYFDIPESAFARYRQQLDQTSQPKCLTCQILVGGDEHSVVAGRVDFFDNRINSGTGTIKLRAVIPNPDGRLVPGAFARVRLPAECLDRALLVPEAAILSELTRKFVYVLSKDQTAEFRPIQVGRQVGSLRVVLAGLQPDDDVIVNGLLLVRPGVKVQLMPPGGMPGMQGMAGQPGASHQQQMAAPAPTAQSGRTGTRPEAPGAPAQTR